MILFSKFMTKFHISSFINKNKYTCNKLKHLKGPAFFILQFYCILYLLFILNTIYPLASYTHSKKHTGQINQKKSYVTKYSIIDQ